jgi:hypothetical protein
LVTSSGPSPVRGFIAAIRHPLSYLGAAATHGGYGACSGAWRDRPATTMSISTSIIQSSGPQC